MGRLVGLQSTGHGGLDMTERLHFHNTLQIKTTIRYHLTSIRMVIIKKKSTTISAKEVVEKRETHYTVGGNINWYNHYQECFLVTQW